MAAFPYDKHHPFLQDPSLIFLIPDRNTTTNMFCFPEQSLRDSYKPYSSPHDQHHPFVDQADPKTVEVLSSVNLKGKKATKETTSSNTDEGCVSLRPEEKLNNKKRGRRSGDNDKKKKETRKNSAPNGYVYVRARRGQATDSHSLAERVRREQIRERMELLQSLVPGCDKISGKALMLDQVINYVQTLQNQVEYLSLKMASISPLFNDEYGMNLEAIMVEQELQKQRMISLEETTNEADVQQQNQNRNQATTDIFNTSDCYEEQKHNQATNNILKTYTSDDYSLIDTSTFLQQAHMSNIMSQSQSHSGFTSNVSSHHLH